MVEKARFLVNLPGPIFIDSAGGDVGSAEIISKIIYNNNKDIFILGECSSACSEYFIPAARRVYSSRNSLIGFHRSDLMAPDFFSDKNKLSRYCGFDRLKWLSKLYKEKNFNPHFYRQTISHIRLSYVYSSNLNAGSGCYNFVSSATANLWYPTSQQLKTGLGLDLGHDICADNEGCWKKAIDETFIEKELLVVGDRYYWSPGRRQMYAK